MTLNKMTPFKELLYLGNSVMPTRQWILGQLVDQRAEGETQVEG